MALSPFRFDIDNCDIDKLFLSPKINQQHFKAFVFKQKLKVEPEVKERPEIRKS